MFYFFLKHMFTVIGTIAKTGQQEKIQKTTITQDR